MRIFKIIFILSLFSIGLSVFAQNEQLTITTYYPAPFGVYRTLQVLNNGEQILIGNDPNNPGIELRDMDAGGNTPYIDFSNDNPVNEDFDMRIILNSDDELGIDGGNVDIDGDLNVDGDITADNIPGCILFAFTAGIDDTLCPAGYSIPMAPVTPAATSGRLLCCQYQ